MTLIIYNIMNRPDKNEYDPYYERYISLITEDDLLGVLGAQPIELRATVADLPEEKGSYAYDEGKWSIKDVLSHLIDGERMFAYRLLRISRGDETPIEGFEQDGYIENAHANDRTFANLLDEFSLLRDANQIYFKNMREDGWQRVGTANNVKISARALAWIMGGHIRHHVNILNERYLN